MGRYWIIGLSWVLAACSPPDGSPDAVVFHGIFVAGEPLDTLYWEVFPPASAADWPGGPVATVRDPVLQQQFSYENFGEGVLLSTDPLIPVAGQTYSVELATPDATLKAEAVMPPAIVPGLISGNTFTVDPENPGEVAFLINWQVMPGYSFLATLACLEEKPVPLPFEETGKFATFYRDPILQSFVSLRSDFFQYYGQHRLTVYAIDKAYEQVFFYLPSGARNLLAAGPDNVEGGDGFVTGVSKWELELVLLP
jgi:hypothetical protein